MLSIQNEIIRKLIHISTAIIPILYCNFSKNDILLILIPVTTFFIFGDFYRRRSIKYKKIYDHYFGGITREEEINSFTGATNVLLSCVIIIIIFNKSIAIASLLIMSISDSIAAIIGRKYGVIKILNKTLEGSIAFFLTSLTIVLFIPKLNIYAAFISVIIVSIIEVIEFNNIDDNITVPLSFAFTYTSVSQIILLFNS